MVFSLVESPCLYAHFLCYIEKWLTLSKLRPINRGLQLNVSIMSPTQSTELNSLFFATNDIEPKQCIPTAHVDYLSIACANLLVSNLAILLYRNVSNISTEANIYRRRTTTTAYVIGLCPALPGCDHLRDAYQGHMRTFFSSRKLSKRSISVSQVSKHQTIKPSYLWNNCSLFTNYATINT